MTAKGADWKIAPERVADVVVTCCGTIRAVCRAASSSGQRKPRSDAFDQSCLVAERPH